VGATPGRGTSAPSTYKADASLGRTSTIDLRRLNKVVHPGVVGFAQK
jgi:hypothetical protein